MSGLSFWSTGITIPSIHGFWFSSCVKMLSYYTTTQCGKDIDYLFFIFELNRSECQFLKKLGHN